MGVSLSDVEGATEKKKKDSAKMIVMQFDTIPPGRNHRCGAMAQGAATRPVYVRLLGNSAGEDCTTSFFKWIETPLNSPFFPKSSRKILINIGDLLLAAGARNWHRYRPRESSVDPIP